VGLSAELRERHLGMLQGLTIQVRTLHNHCKSKGVIVSGHWMVQAWLWIVIFYYMLIFEQHGKVLAAATIETKGIGKAQGIESHPLDEYYLLVYYSLTTTVCSVIMLLLRCL
jgi:hypothetical protein